MKESEIIGCRSVLCDHDWRVITAADGREYRRIASICEKCQARKTDFEPLTRDI